MKPRHIVQDRHTGEVRVQARGGATYSADELAAIERRADAGDAEALAIIDSLDVTGMTAEDLLHDCPECRAALERGEQPITMSPEQLRALQRPPTGRMRPVMRRRPYRRHR
jgi:hypothetical protein